MKYLSIDIETTGLDESFCQTLEVGAVLADTLDFTTPIEELPHFQARFYYDRVIGQPFALHMNAQLILDMETRPPGLNYMHPDSFWSNFTSWFEGQYKGPKISLSGKNVATFDLRFLRKLPRWQPEYFKQRVLDPGQYFFRKDDEQLPDLKTCVARSGIDWDIRTHHCAVEDARAVVKLNRVGLQRLWYSFSENFRSIDSFDMTHGQAVVYETSWEGFRIVTVHPNGRLVEGINGPSYFKEDCPYSFWAPLSVEDLPGA